VTTTPVAADDAAVDIRDPEVRLRSLFDEGTMRLLIQRDDSGALSARGEIDGTPAVAFATDATRMGGAMGTEGCRHIVDSGSGTPEAPGCPRRSPRSTRSGRSSRRWSGRPGGCRRSPWYSGRRPAARRTGRR